MSAKSIALAAVLLLLASLAGAAVIEIPLPQLLGSYQNTQRTTTIVLPAQPAVIHGASFRISGTTVLGQADCPEEGGVLPMPMDLEAQMFDDTPAKVWFAVDHGEMQAGGAFSWTASFQKTPLNTSWSFLMDGVGDITLYGMDPFTWCNMLSSPSAVVTEAVFIIDAEFPVAVQPSTWGRIKALYR